MINRVFLPRKQQDPFFGDGGLVDRMFDASFPYKLLKAFAPDTDATSSAFLPSIDVKSDDKAYTIHAEIPGVAKENVKLEVHDGVLVLSGEKKDEVTSGEGTTAHVVERRFGSFERRMTLPDDADVDHIKANHKNGVLTVEIPRVAPKETKKAISITSTEA